MQFQVMASVVSAGNHSFAVDYYSKYKKPYHWQLQALHIFLSLETKLPTLGFVSKIPILKPARAYAFFALQ